LLQLPKDFMKDRIALTGVTGYIGGRLAPRLLGAGYAIRCLVRFPAKLDGRDWVGNPDVEIERSDLANSDALAASLKGCRAAFYLVHSMSSARSDYVERDLFLATIFAEAARQAGVQRIVYLGGLGETGKDLSQHLASRREVEKAMASAGVPVTVLRVPVPHHSRFCAI